MEPFFAMIGSAVLLVLALLVVMPIWSLAEGKQKLRLRELDVQALEAKARIAEARGEHAFG